VALVFFEDKIQQIEIEKDSRKETVFFPKLPICDLLNENMKQQFELQVDRSSTKSKVESLMNIQEELVLQMETESLYLNNPLFRKARFLKVFAKYEELFKDMAFLFALIYHFLILFTFDLDGQRGKGLHHSSSLANVQMLVKLAWVMFALSILIFFFTVVKRVLVISHKNAKIEEI